MNIQRLSLLIFAILGTYLSHGQNSSELIYLDQDKLTYVPFPMTGKSNAVNTIPDFSHAGYMGGGVALPTDILIGAIVTPEEGDDAYRIQSAINTVSALEPDDRGFRGVVLIKAGHYSLNNLLSVRASGVVLRGEGQGLNGTVIHANPRVEHSVINIFGSGSILRDAESIQPITSDYVPVGSYTFDVEDASNYAIGDKIIISRTPNQNWIDDLGMDQESLCQGKTDCSGWTPTSYAIDNERTITEISGNTISIDIPIVDVIEDVYGGGTITKVEQSRRISHCGVENIRIQSFYRGDTDESHAWTAIRLDDTEHCWVKQVTGQYLSYSTVNIENSNFTTVQDCAYIDPKSPVTGGRRYSFAIQDGLGNLIQRCYSKNGRHDYVTGSRVAGPNVFLDALVESAQSDIGPHHRWATGILFDNIRAGSTRVWNRGNSGTGHGWSGAQVMFWNIDSYKGEFRVDSPLGAINWGIGCIGSDQTGEGYWENWGDHVQPRSLYLQQLQDRLGVDAIDNITIPAQRSGDIYELLSTWGGHGDFSDGGFFGEAPEISFTDPTTIIDVSTWEGGDIHVEATDSDGTVASVKLLINGELVATDNEAPYIFDNLTSQIQNLSHEIHFLQAIVTDNDGNTNVTRLAIEGGDPPPIIEEEEESQVAEIRTFPNPVQNGEITISMKKKGIYFARFFDILGQKIDDFSFEGLTSQYTIKNTTTGIYFLEISDEQEVIYKTKLTVQ